MGLGGPDDELGARGVGQRLAVLAVSGVDDLDVRAGVAVDDLLAGDLVDDDDVGLSEVLQGPHRHQPGVPGTGADEGDAGRGAGGGGGSDRAGGAHRSRSVAFGVDGGLVVRGARSAAPSSRRSRASARPTALGVGGQPGGGAAQVDGAVDARDDGAQRQLDAVVALDDLGEGADRRGAAGLELGEDGALGDDAGAGVGVVEGGDGVAGGGVVGADLDGQGALAGAGSIWIGSSASVTTSARPSRRRGRPGRARPRRARRR